MNVVKSKTYPITRYSSVEVEGRSFYVWNEVTGLRQDYVYPTYDDAKQAARELGDHYYHTERRAGWR